MHMEQRKFCAIRHDFGTAHPALQKNPAVIRRRVAAAHPIETTLDAVLVFRVFADRKVGRPGLCEIGAQAAPRSFNPVSDQSDALTSTRLRPLRLQR